MNETNKRNENDTIKQVLYNSKYDIRILNKITLTNDVQEQQEVKIKTKWTKFTHVGRQNKFITRVFKNRFLKSLSRLTTP